MSACTDHTTSARPDIAHELEAASRHVARAAELAEMVELTEGILAPRDYVRVAIIQRLLAVAARNVRLSRDQILIDRYGVDWALYLEMC